MRDFMGRGRAGAEQEQGRSRAEAGQEQGSSRARAGARHFYSKLSCHMALSFKNSSMLPGFVDYIVQVKLYTVKASIKGTQ